MPQVIRAWREQTVQPGRIVVMDNSPPDKTGGGDRFISGEQYPNPQFRGADDVWRSTMNLGCPCHFYPALALFDFKYVMFADDDFLPGPGALSNLLGAAKALEDRFVTIGEVGRDFLLGNAVGRRYSGRNQPAVKEGGIVPVHLTCRSHLVRSDLLYHFIPFRQRLVEMYGFEGRDLASVHDDFLMCMGIQLAIGFRSYLVGKTVDPMNRLFMRELDTEGDGLWKRPNHFAERNKMVDMSLGVGWKPQ